MAIKVKYNSIIKKLKEVSKIDIETIFMNISTKEDCPSCELDPFTKRPMNSFCPTCGGSGVIVENDTININANVDYSGFENETSIGGIIKDGRVIVTIITDEFEENGIDPEDFLTDKYPIDHIYINSTKYDVEKVIPGKLQGILYELMLELVPAKG